MTQQQRKIRTLTNIVKAILEEMLQRDPAGWGIYIITKKPKTECFAKMVAFMGG